MNTFPSGAPWPIRAVSVSGTDTALVRLGDHLAARFTLRVADVETTRHRLAAEAEADAARELPGPASADVMTRWLSSPADLEYEPWQRGLNPNDHVPAP